ncbi:protein yop-1 [Colletotrichum spaethianum]|uniref:Protein YOP1 n=1 Tax=Colletotrichum spaethianum TaxID=700344 RepID=A0AA37PBU2_9PEZI|nr:protein yop-1 [Colletotrichum spaethianum]GKT49309.1 protein yop-1 [Colletotrichum spaethianum]
MSAQDRVQNYIGQLDRELSKYPALNNIEKSTNVPKAYAVIGVASLYFFLIIFNLGGQLLTNFAGFVIPGYYSLNALFTANKQDDTQWLTYWVVFAFFTVAESLVNVVYWFPFYFTFKFVFLLWLALPTFRYVPSLPNRDRAGADCNQWCRDHLQLLPFPMLAKHFNSASTASGLRAQAGKAE